ncbi:hypothetical protein [Hymenobacter sp. B1770]|uniref:hypothetical protein n=1 Tax=Hymenobacter sp. B1770 TaxID=1718788 RepID=UPI003CE8E3F5
MENPFTSSTPTRTGAPTWSRTTSTLAVSEHMNDLEAQPPADPIPPVAPEQPSGAALVSAPFYEPGPPPEMAPPEPPPPLPTMQSEDGRVVLTDATLTVRGHAFLLLELERAELTPVRWILWYLLGSIGLATVMIAFLQNWLRTGPAMIGMALTALLLAYGHRGTNRLRLHRLGREMVNFALPGDTAGWQRLTAEVNRRIFRAHNWAARQAAYVLAAADEATRQAAEAAQAAAQAEAGAEQLDN